MTFISPQEGDEFAEKVKRQQEIVKEMDVLSKTNSLESESKLLQLKSELDKIDEWIIKTSK